MGNAGAKRRRQRHRCGLETVSQDCRAALSPYRVDDDEGKLPPAAHCMGGGTEGQDVAEIGGGERMSGGHGVREGGKEAGKGKDIWC